MSLATLHRSIADVGYWSWWIGGLPAFFQIEFGGVQLYFPPLAPNEAPSSRLAFQFRHPLSVSFLTRQTGDETPQSDWVRALHEDALEMPTCDREAFALEDETQMRSMLQTAENIETLHGCSPDDAAFFAAPARLVFWAGDYGLAIAAEELRLLSQQGQVALDEIPDLHQAWWAYWERYWQHRDTEYALPQDYACEVTIPA